MAGIFQNGVWSLGFDMDPTSAQIFSLANGNADNGTTPLGFGYSWKMPSGVTSQLNFNTNLLTVIQGIRVFFSTMPGTSGIFLQWWDTTANASQVTLRVFADGHLQFFLGNGTGTPLGSASATGVLALSTWAYVETKVTINATTGVVECKVNGTSVITASGLNTKSTANVWVSGMQIGTPSTGNAFFDDWYILDTTGSSPLNTYLGNVQVRGDAPSNNSANGARNAFAPTNPTNVNYTNVGNIPANAAEHNDSSNAGDYDMFRFPALSTTTVFFLNEWALLELDSAGSRTVELNCNSGGTDNASAAFTPPTGTPTYSNLVQTVDPNTSSAWGVSAAGSAEFGVKVQT